MAGGGGIGRGKVGAVITVTVPSLTTTDRAIVGSGGVGRSKVGAVIIVTVPL